MVLRRYGKKWVAGVMGLCLAHPLWGLPVVESRTGEPAVRQQAPVSALRASMTSEDRAAHLTLSHMEALQKEVSELRGVVEMQEHEIKQLKKSQQDLYLDLDRRLGLLQQSSPSRGSGSHAGMRVQKSTAASSNVAPPVASSVPKSPSASASSTVKSAPIVAKPEIMKTTIMNPAPAVSSSIKGAGVTEQEAYQAAYSLVKTKRYPEAVSAFQDYLDRFPKGEHAGHAHYWLGEVYRVQGQNDKANVAALDKASAEFSSITTHFPNHPKAADATLKLGLIEFDKGNEAAAIQYFTDVKNRYPGTAAARIADTRLQQLSAE